MIQLYTTVRITCKLHDLDKEIMYVGTPIKTGDYIRQEMKKFGCTDYKSITRTAPYATDGNTKRLSFHVQ